MKKSKNRLLKEKQVAELTEEIKKYPVVGLFELTNLPARYLQMAKRKLRDKAVFRIAKKAVLLRAIKNVGLPDDFVSNAKGPFGIILTNDSPFMLFKNLKKSRGQAYAKPGQIAPTDITIPAGETPFPAGPVLSEFKQAGLNVKIVGGKIHIASDKVVAKEGEAISEGAAKILQKLDIKPFEVGVELSAAFREGIIYARDILDVDEKEYLNNVVRAFSDARALAVEIGYPAKETIELLLVKAFSNARNLCVSEGILEKDVVDLVLANAQAKATALKNKIGG